MNRRRGGIVVALAALAATAGCVNYTAPERYERGLVVVLGGAGNVTMSPDSIRWGLHEGGVDHAIEVFQWTKTHNVLEDQTDVARNRAMAGRLASRVTAYMAERPGRPVHLVGLSAGTGLVVFALEQLPPRCQIDGACLLASSLKDTYNLAPALRHVRNEITNFSSVMDVVVLGVGVGFAGTVDRGQGTAAGIAGFKVPPDVDDSTRRLYGDKLVEVPWNPAYVVFGHAGTHTGAASSGFVKQFMAPIVLDAARRRADEWTPGPAVRTGLDSQ